MVFICHSIIKPVVIVDLQIALDKNLIFKTMSRLLLVSIALLLTKGSFSQVNEQEFLFSHNNKPKVYAGFSLTHLAVKSNTLPGIEAGVILADHLYAGVYGMGTAGNFTNVYAPDTLSVMFGEGGLALFFVDKPNNLLHFGGGIRIGYASFVADDKEIKIFEEVDPVAEDNALVYHPEIFAEINLSPFSKVRVGAGYSFYLFDQENILCNKSLDSWTMNLGIVFSNFNR